jgi:endonuclease YncB( thermonuclease family)
MRALGCGAAIALLASTAVAAASFSGRVVSVSDGDTIAVMRDGRAQRVRLHGIDCPESGQAYGTRAKQFTAGLAFGNLVTITIKDTDRYGRTVGQVNLPDGKNLAHELLRAGLAWWYRQYAAKESLLARLEVEARTAKRGLWSDAQPMPPWEHRKHQRASRREYQVQ